MPYTGSYTTAPGLSSCFKTYLSKIFFFTFIMESKPTALGYIHSRNFPQNFYMRFKVTNKLIVKYSYMHTIKWLYLLKEIIAQY
jgi:hypothetical protein